MTRAAFMLAATLVLGGAHMAAAADVRFPDWPCQQLKVPQLSVAAVWAGPPIDDVGTAWRDDPQIADLVARLAARRTPLEAAEKSVTDFLNTTGVSKQQKARLLSRRPLHHSSIRIAPSWMDGIERFTRRCRSSSPTRSAVSEAEAMRGLQDTAGTAPAKIDELGNAIAWDTRVFDERRQTIGFVCEVLRCRSSQRLFAPLPRHPAGDVMMPKRFQMKWNPVHRRKRVKQGSRSVSLFHQKRGRTRGSDRPNADQLARRYPLLRRRRRGLFFARRLLGSRSSGRKPAVRRAAAGSGSGAL